MRTWRINRFVHRCPGCKRDIGVGDKMLTDIGAGRVVRCQSCGERMFGEAAPEVIEDPEQTSAVPDGVRHQPSLGFEAVGALVRHLRSARR